MKSNIQDLQQILPILRVIDKTFDQILVNTLAANQVKT